VATPVTRLDATEVRQRVLEVIGGLLEELGSRGALPMLNAGSQLDRDLGLGSLERVELMARLETALGVALPDSVVAEANTPGDLARAICAIQGIEAPTGKWKDGQAPPLQAESGADGREESARAATGAFAIPKELRRGPADEGVAALQTLEEVLRYRGMHDAERTHLAIAEEKDGKERSVTLTFGELYGAAQRCAAELAKRGVPAGGRVALMLPTSRAFFVSYAGILLAGAIPVPIYPPFRADRIEEYATRQSAILKNAGVCLLLTFRQAEAVARLLKPKVPSLAEVADAEKLLDAANNALPAPAGALPVHLSGSRMRKAEDIALLQYTSGSTGDPKGVVLTHANLLANIRAIGEALEIKSDDVAVSWLPLYHDMGLIGAWLTPLYFGLPLAVMSPLAFLTRPERWLKAVQKYGGTLGAAPNFAYELCVRKIADKEIEGLDLSTWRTTLNGAEPVNPETLERFAERFARYGFRREAQLPVYGLAEASLAVTIPPLGRRPLVDRVERKAFTEEGRAIPAAKEDASAIAFVSSGPPIPRHEVRIVDGSGSEAPDRTEGFLWFRGPSATGGYYENEEATAALFPQGAAKGTAGGPGPGATEANGGEHAWVNSGDRAYQADGEIYVTGRVKDIIIKGGRNLYPHEVEELTGRVEGIRKGCVVAFGAKDEGSGTEKLIVVAESRERDGARRVAIEAAVKEQVTQGLGVPPDRVELIPAGSIPKTSSGKLRRDETKRLFLDGKLDAAKTPAWLQISRLAATSTARTVGADIRLGLRRGLEILYGLYFYVVFAVWIVPTWAIVMCIRDYRKAGEFTSRALRILFALAGCRVTVKGKENMGGAGAKVYASNHASYFDVLALMLGLGVGYRFVAKSEVTRMPLIGNFLRRMGHVSFDRSDTQARLQQSEQLEKLLREGESVFVFPEGTFSPEDGVRPFQLGAFRAAVDAGAPIVPISLAGTRRFLRDETYLPRPTSVTITVSAPIYPRAGGNVGSGAAQASWRELIRLRDETRETIARYSGEALL
jgi:fatty-acyl-CoA synthase